MITPTSQNRNTLLILVLFISLVNPWTTVHVKGQNNGPDALVKPHTFHPGTPAKSSEVNENFDVLYGTINELMERVDTLNTKLKLATAHLQGEVYDTDAFDITSASVTYDANLDSLIFTTDVTGLAGSVEPVPAGGVDGAPVLGYVFLTDLSPSDIGFDGVVGFDTATKFVGLAITSHPDFDDTPLWDENGNADFDDDGVVYHSHWVLLVEDDRASKGLAVLQRNFQGKINLII